MLEFTLKKQKHTVLVAIHGREALEKLAATAVDLVITDVSMPEMDGIALLQQLRNEPSYAEMPVILLTVSEQVEDRLRAEELGADGFLNKPASSLELLQTVAKFV